jgi:hypothetical protein
MCHEHSPDAIPTSDSRLTGVLTPDVPPIPKVAFPKDAVDDAAATHAMLCAKLASPPNENATYHVTADSLYLATTTALASNATDSGVVAVGGPLGGLVIEVTPPSPAQGQKYWTFGIFTSPGHKLAALTGEPEPQATFEVAATGSSATIVGYRHAPEVEGYGLNIPCIASAGGGTILSTIITCLPALAGGPGAFREALLAALQGGGVDLITKLMKCF